MFSEGGAARRFFLKKKLRLQDLHLETEWDGSCTNKAKIYLYSILDISDVYFLIPNELDFMVYNFE